jgi:hypothetical protein
VCLNKPPCSIPCGNNSSGGSGGINGTDGIVGSGGNTGSGSISVGGNQAKSNCGSSWYDSGNGWCISVGWTKLGTSGFNNTIYTLATDASGNVYAAGNFTNAGGYHYVAQWNGTAWSELGSLNANGYINSIAIDATGNVYATGEFHDFDGYNYMAKWDGTAWSEIKGVDSNILGATYADAVGNVYNGFKKWGGTAWSTIFTGDPNSINSVDPNSINSVVEAYATNASGSTQYAAGDFSNGATPAGGYKFVAQWDGSSVSALGNLNANNTIDVLATDASGNVYAAGVFTNGPNSWSGSKYLAKWDGTTWSEVGTLNANGTITSIGIDPSSGNIYVTGEFTDAEGQYYVAEWNGSAWSEIGRPGVNHVPLAVDASGRLYSATAAVVMPSGDVVFDVMVRN